MLKKKIFLLLICLAIICSSVIVSSAAPAVTLVADITTVNCGDSITFVLNVSGSEKTKSLGVVLKYDSNIFEFVSGEMLVKGAMLVDFSDGIGVAAYTSESDVNGDIASFILKVKDGAEIGKAVVECDVNLGTGGEAVDPEVTINIACNHVYGEWEKHNEAQHKHSCKCGDVQYENHKWDAGEVITPATHETVGEKKYTCTECGEVKTEEIPKKVDHVYGEWEKHNEAQHKHLCKCGDVQYENHKWDAGEVTTPATHETVGEKKYTCTECGEVKTEEIPAIENNDDVDNPPTGDLFIAVCFMLVVGCIIAVLKMIRKSKI